METYTEKQDDLTVERIAVLPASGAPTNSTASPVDDDLRRDIIARTIMLSYQH